MGTFTNLRTSPFLGLFLWVLRPDRWILGLSFLHQSECRRWLNFQSQVRQRALAISPNTILNKNECEFLHLSAREGQCIYVFVCVFQAEVSPILLRFSFSFEVFFDKMKLVISAEIWECSQAKRLAREGPMFTFYNFPNRKNAGAKFPCVNRSCNYSTTNFTFSVPICNT